MNPPTPNKAFTFASKLLNFKQGIGGLQSQSWRIPLITLVETVLGTHHPVTVNQINKLALIYLNEEKYKRAEPLLKRVLKSQEKSLNPKHPDLAQSMNNLADVYQNTSEYEKAERLYLKTLKIRAKRAWCKSSGSRHDFEQSWPPL